MRAKRTRARIKGNGTRPRLSVFRSNRHLYVQLIDDMQGKTLVSASSLEVKDKKAKTDLAKAVGTLLAKKAKNKNISSGIFDRGSYKYHGRVKAAAEGAREGGLKI